MFKKFAATLIIVTTASVGFFACSSDSSSFPTNAIPSSSGDESCNSSSPNVILSSSSESSLSSSVPSTTSSSWSEAIGSSNSSSSNVILSSSSESSLSSSVPSATSSSWSEAIGSSNNSSSNVILSSSSEESSNSSSSSNKVTEPAEVYLWNDEFDGETIDTSKWTYDIGTGSNGWGNNEKEYYTSRKDNAYIKDGVLHICAKKEDYEGQKYTSARMLTKGKFAFKYGTVEARIALPTGKGIWPAFWMLGENFDTVGWPACGEIDIIEAVNSENIVYGTNHWANGSEYATYGNNTGSYRDQKHKMDITQFHTYKFTWDEKYIRMFVDDFMYHEILIENSTGDTEEFHKPFFFLLNVAVAGNWPGFEVDDTQFPNEMLVDYIRVYK